MDFAKRAEDMMDAVRREYVEEYIGILELRMLNLSAAGVKRTDAVIRKLRRALK